MTLRELRVKYNISQSKLAKILEVSQVTVSHWEKGKTKMSKRVKLALAQIFKLDDWREIEDYDPKKFNLEV